MSLFQFVNYYSSIFYIAFFKGKKLMIWFKSRSVTKDPNEEKVYSRWEQDFHQADIPNIGLYDEDLEIDGRMHRVLLLEETRVLGEHRVLLLEETRVLREHRVLLLEETRVLREHRVLLLEETRVLGETPHGGAGDPIPVHLQSGESKPSCLCEG
ncbi:uncharacterized protein LOC110452058 [Mizuhopecten yessoensis]|uniref:uncharacterized protein LOC110452058 n=1 Tax=Mizuhopecten yessoensis TaxID=6573 RepID=UPI000B45AAA2|nr:uncharacterized protein LOC110452058 [Mizuhopecten yessoensis]